MRTYYPNAAPRSPAAPSPAVTELMMECEADSEEETPLRPAALAPKQQHPLAILSHTPVPTRSKPVGALATLKEEEGEGRHAVECEGEAAEQQQQGHEQEQGQAQAQAQEQDGELETVAAEASTCRATTPLQDAQRARNPGLAALADLAVTAPPLAPSTTLPTLSTPVAPFTPVAVAAPKAKGEGAQAAGAAKPFICAVPGCEKNYMDQQGMDQHYEFNHPELPLQRPAPGAAGTAIGVGSRVVDSAGAFGEIIARNGAWLTMRTDAGEERNVRKVDLELVTPEAGAGSCLPQMETTSQPTPPPAPAPAVGGGGTEAEPAAAGKEVAAPKATGECVQAARTAIGVGSRVVDSAGAFGEIIARNGAWLTMRTDAGEERNVRKVDLELVTPEAGAGSCLPQMETTSQPTPPPAPAPAVGGGGTEAEPAAAGKEVAAPKATGECVQAARTAIGVGSRVVDSAGAFGEIIARNGAWLTMRTDAGEERNVRKVDLELVTPEAGAGSCLPQMETTSQPTPPPAPAPAVGGGGTEAEPAAAGKEVAAPKATGECVQAARTAIGVGSRVVDSAGAFGEIIARNGAWLTMRTDAGEERNVRKVDLELVTPEAGAGSCLPQMETTSQPTPPPAPAPAVGGGGTEAEPAAAGKEVAAPKATGECVQAARTAIGVGSRVVDSAGAFGEIIARNGAWLTMRTDAGEERNVRKVDLELVTPEAGAGSCLPQMETTSQPTPPPAPAPAVGGGGTEAEPAAAGKEVAAPKATGECVQAARTAIGVGSRVVDSAGAFGEIIARNGAWLTMRTDAGEERNVRKVDLELVTPEAEAMPEAAAAYSLRQRGTQPHVKVGTAVEAAVEDAPEPPEHISPSDGLVTEVDGLQLHLSAASSTGYRGVVDYSQSGKERDRPFKAQATAPRVRTLGHFATKVEAAVCYAKWALQEGRGQAVAVPEDMEAAALAHARSVDSARRADERGGVLDSGPKAAAAQQGAAAAALGAAGAAAAPTAASGSAWEAKRRGRSAAPEWQLAEAAAEPEAKRRCVSVSAVAPGSLSSAATDAKRPRRATGSELASPVQRAEPLLFGRRASAPEQSGQRHATEGAS